MKTVDISALKQRVTCADVLKRHGIAWNGKDISCPLPGHEDRKPSFGLCHDTRAFCCHGCNRKGDVIELEALLDGGDKGRAIHTLADMVGMIRPEEKPKRLVEIYDYPDADGKLLFQVLRYDPKGFTQRRPDPVKANGWIWNMDGVTRVLYRLPDVLTAKAAGRVVFLAEGEKDCNALAALGLCATCNPGGAGKWQDGYTATLIGAKVIILPDRDAPGRRHAALVLKALTGKAKSVRVVELPDRNSRKVKDAADWIAAGGTIEELRQIVQDAPAWEPPVEETDRQTPVEPLGALRELKPGATVEEIGDALRTTVAGLKGREARALGREECLQRLKELGVNAPARLVDAFFETAEHADKSAEGGDAITLADPEPWPDPVDGRELLEEIKETIEHLVILPEQSAIAAALWILHAHTQDAAFISPLLALCSPEKRCGKTTLLQVVGELTPRSLFASNITPPALFRTVEKYKPTLLIDEADTFLQDNDELRGILNAGHTQKTAYVVRTKEPDFEPVMFKTWCPKAIAMIGKLKDTLEDRSIVCQLRRKSSGEKVERLRQDRLAALLPVRRKAWRWGRDNLDNLRNVEPTVPPELHDRAADNWRPLLAISEAIGGKWPEHARHAALALSCRDAGETESIRELLLSDIRTMFENQNTDRLFSENIVNALGGMEDRPWPEYVNGHEITKGKLARLLKPFKIAPRPVRIGNDAAKGYLLEDFRDAFARYLPPVGGTESVTPLQRPSLLAETPIQNVTHKEGCNVFNPQETPVDIELSRCNALKGGGDEEGGEI